MSELAPINAVVTSKDFTDLLPKGTPVLHHKGSQPVRIYLPDLRRNTSLKQRAAYVMEQFRAALHELEEREGKKFLVTGVTPFEEFSFVQGGLMEHVALIQYISYRVIE